MTTTWGIQEDVLVLLLLGSGARVVAVVVVNDPKKQGVVTKILAVATFVHVSVVLRRRHGRFRLVRYPNPTW